MLCCGSHNHGNDHDQKTGACAHKPWYRKFSGLATAGLLAVIGYYLWTEHRAHVIAFLPFAIFLLCPLMHLFGHGHGSHDHGAKPLGSAADPTGKPAGGTKGPLS